MAHLPSILQITSRLAAPFRRPPISSSLSDPHNLLESIQWLKTTQWSINAVLEDAQKREIREATMNLWLKELKSIAFEMEDVMDEYTYELLQDQVESQNKGASTAPSRKRKSMEDEEKVCFSMPSALLNDMLHKIQTIRERLNEIEKDRSTLNLRDLGPRLYDGGSINPSPTSSFVDESTTIFGQDSDKKAVIELLFADMSCKFSLIPIVGMGGLGKTTLARTVYNDSRVCEYFDLRRWVCVSEDFDVYQLTKAIIGCFSTQQFCSFDEPNRLQRLLSARMQGNKVLIVLDDVWNEEQSSWLQLQTTFGGAEIVRIIVTTRNNSVAEAMQTGSPLYKLSCLSGEHSWLLFKLHAFDSVRNPDGELPHLVGIGKQIVKRCEGLPLALKVLGSNLRCETEESMWWDVLQSDLWELDEAQAEILPALKLSYRRMPPYLKPCFQFCSMYPKDHDFDKDKLISIWMAHGFIQCRGNRIVEDVGEEYFKELYQRSYFQPLGTDAEDGYVMHDMIHDLANFVSEKECSTVMLEDKLHRQHEVSCGVRHLNVINRSKKHHKIMKCLCLEEPKSLRTFDYSHVRNVDGDEDLLIKLRGLRVLELFVTGAQGLLSSVAGLKHLRYLCLNIECMERLPEPVCQLYNLQTLDLKFCHLKEIPSGIGNLINLRCLRLGSETVNALPGSIGRLRTLQTLDVAFCLNLEELPQETTELVNLRHLYLHSVRLPHGIGRLSNLQTLKHFRVELEGKHCGITELKKLVNLRGELCLSGLETVVHGDDAKVANLSSKSQLKVLQLSWHNTNNNILSDGELNMEVLENLQPHTNLMHLHIGGYSATKLPIWLGDPSFSKLTRINLSNCSKIQAFSLLSQLPSLTHLSLCEITTMRLLKHVDRISFPSLEELSFRGMSEWEEWSAVIEEEFPHLMKLHIENCPKLWRLPSLQSLVNLKVSNCDSLSSLTVHHEAACPSRLSFLWISDCQQLKSIMGLKYVTSLAEMKLYRCYQLQFSPDDCLPAMPKYVHICDWNGPKHWCKKHGFYYKQFCSDREYSS